MRHEKEKNNKLNKKLIKILYNYNNLKQIICAQRGKKKSSSYNHLTNIPKVAPNILSYIDGVKKRKYIVKILFCKYKKK